MSDLIRVLTLEEAHHRDVRCCWYSESDPDCQRMAVMRLATPHGHQDFCREHIGYAIADLPREWLDGFAYREPVTLDSGDDIPF